MEMCFSSGSHWKQQITKSTVALQAHPILSQIFCWHCFLIDVRGGFKGNWKQLPASNTRWSHQEMWCGVFPWNMLETSPICLFITNFNHQLLALFIFAAVGHVLEQLYQIRVHSNIELALPNPSNSLSSQIHCYLFSFFFLRHCQDFSLLIF